MCRLCNQVSGGEVLVTLLKQKGNKNVLRHIEPSFSINHTSQEMTMKRKTPLLTTDQLKRFRKALVDYQIYPSMFKAIQSTDSAKKCRVAFFQLIDFNRLMFIGDNIPDMGIDDIHDLYAPDDAPKETHNKVIQLANEANQTHNKVRGKQKSPTMQHYKTRLPVDTLDRLKALDGAVSEHIRQAIDNYLNTKQAN